MTIRGILLGPAAAALLASPAFAAAGTNQRLDQLEEMVRQQNQDAWWHDTKISGRMYFDVTDYTEKKDGAKAGGENGIGFDIKRFYIGIDHRFDGIFSADITTDFTYDSSTKATQLYIKKAYLDAHIDDALDIRLGSTDLPWIAFAEGVYGYRYVENTLIDRTKIGTSADWGLHLQGKFAHGMFGYAISAINGAGYKAPPGPGNAIRFKTIDFEGRVNATIDHITVAVGGYDGKLGKDVEGATTHHTATRFDALAAYTDDRIRAGVEYFSANDWNSVTSLGTDSEDGWSGFASYKFDPQWAVFGRYDWVHETLASANKPRNAYYNFGVEWTPAKIVSLSLVYKHDSVTHGGTADQNGNGTIGDPATLAGKGTFNEIGLFGIFQW